MSTALGSPLLVTMVGSLRYQAALMRRPRPARSSLADMRVTSMYRWYYKYVDMLAYRFALDPTPAQERALRSHAGAARVAFNWGLGRVKANLGQREAEKGYGITDLTPSLSWSMYSLRKDWNTAKADVAPWWAENSKESYAGGLANLATGLQNWKDSRTGKRKGPRVGFPKFKSKHKSRPSCRFTTGIIRCEARHAVLPRIGRVKLHENATALTGKIEAGTARIMAATVRFERGRWFVSFTVEAERTQRAPAQPNALVGVDLGIKTLAVLSDGTQVPNPKHLNAALRKIRRLSRAMSRKQGPDRRTRRHPSNRWVQASAALGTAQGRVADQRRDATHKLTTDLARQYGTVVVEDLNVAGMVRNKRLARAIADASFAEVRRQLAYKTEWNGGRLIVADRWFASSKTCSGCGAVKTKLLLSERTYVCTACGAVLDRDENAAINLARYGEQVIAGSGPEINGRGADRKTGLARQVAVKRQPGTAHAGQTGTVPPQGRTAA
jgi:IS605 OrfB family transposase